jgi:hypothetical protein
VPDRGPLFGSSVLPSDSAQDPLILQLEHPEYDEWRIGVYVDLRTTPPVIVGLSVLRYNPASRWDPDKPYALPAPPTADGVTSDVLRSVPLGDVTMTVNHHLRVLDAIEPARARRRLPKAARRRLSEHELAMWAHEYVKQLRSSRRPIADLAERHGESAERVRDLLHTARERGLLTKGRRGVAEGELTEKGRDALKKRRRGRR